MKIYISGPMTGLPDLNRPAFHATAAELRALGHEVINPAELPKIPGGAWADYMRADIKLLVDCDAIYLLEGWFWSNGARLEWHIANELGLQIIDPRWPQ